MECKTVYTFVWECELYTFQTRFQIAFQSPQKFSKFAKCKRRLRSRKESLVLPPAGVTIATAGSASAFRCESGGTSTEQVGQLSFVSLCSIFWLYIESI